MPALIPIENPDEPRTIFPKLRTTESYFIRNQIKKFTTTLIGFTQDLNYFNLSP